MRRLIVIVLLVFTCSLFMVAQDHSKAEVFGGYQWTSVDTGSGSDRLNFNGWDAALTGFFNKNVGITADISGAYKSESGVDVKVYSYLFGPTFRAPGERVTPFAHALFGAAHASAGFGGTGLGSENAFAYALGGGVDVNAGKNVAIRIAQFDFLGTRFSSENQKNFRYSGGIVFKF